MIAFVVATLTSCNTVEYFIPELPIIPTATSEPLSTETSTGDAYYPELNITIVSVVMDVSLSARIIVLIDSVESFHVLA